MNELCVIELSSSSVAQGPVGKQPSVTKIERKFFMDGPDILCYEVKMETSNTPLQVYRFTVLIFASNCIS
jgi:hypothetical protein